jgi:hypothetical protein
MTTTPTKIKAKEQANDTLRDARRCHRRVEVRRVAAIRPEGAHFKLRPLCGSLQAAQS